MITYLRNKMNGMAGGICFLCIFFLLLVPLSYCLRTNGDIKDIFNGFYGEKPNSLDVVMIGSSPVYPCFAAPKIWEEHGIACYPLSSNMQRPRAAIHLVKEAEKTQNPSLYVFELRMYLGPEERLMENMAYTRGVTDNMKYSLNRLETIRDLVPQGDEDGRYSYYFDLFKYHSNWKTLIQPGQLATFAYSRRHPMKGAVVKDEVGPSEMADYSGVTQRQAIPAEQEEVLRELLTYLQENGLDALFVVAPNTMTEEKQKQYNYISDIVREAGYGYLNMNDYYREIGIDFEVDFADYGGHTNAIGMEKCSVFLGNYLKEHYSIPDKRGESAYESWDEAARLWESRTREAEQTIRERLENGDFYVTEE